MYIVRYRGNYRCLPTGFEDEFVALNAQRLIELAVDTLEDPPFGGVDVVRSVIQYVPRTLGQPVVVSVERNGPV